LIDIPLKKRRRKEKKRKVEIIFEEECIYIFCNKGG